MHPLMQLQTLLLPLILASQPPRELRAAAETRPGARRGGSGRRTRAQGRG